MPRVRWRSTRLRTGGTFFVLALLLFTAVGLLSGQMSRRQSEADSGALLAQLGTRLLQGLDIGMLDRLREVENLAALETAVAADISPAGWRAVFERLQSTMPYYSWIGLADAKGQVLAATGDLLRGRDVSQRPWFASGLRGPAMGDVHDAMLLRRLLPAQADGEPLRLLDFSAPIERNGRVAGVLGAHLSLRWAEERRRQTLDSLDPARGVELLLLDGQGRLILGPAEPALPSAVAGSTLPAPALLRWGDGQRYLTAAVRATGYQGHAGLGWTVVVRQPEATATAAAGALQQRIWLLGGVGALVFGLVGWWLAGRLSAPLAQLAYEARLATGAAAPALADEVEQLAQALSRLLVDLHQREQALAGLNATLETRVQQRTQSLQQANDDLQSFSRSVAHDLKGPIGGMGMVLRNLLDKPGSVPDAAGRRTLGLLEQECYRLCKLTDELMTLAMVEQHTLRRKPVPLRELVDDVLAALRSAPGGEAARRAEVLVRELPTLPVDPTLLRQVWHNLLANAVKFSARAESPQIEVSAYREGGGEGLDEDGWAFCVADNGAGFDMAQSHRLFGVFQRLHRASDFPGTGVGLSIVKRVVHRHGGRVWAEGQPGQGARFCFTLSADPAVLDPIDQK